MDGRVLFSAFALVFLAELGDKTQLAVMAQVCRHRRPWAVFAGATVALTAVTALGAAAGQVLGRIVPESALRAIAAAAFVGMGLRMAWEAWRGGREEGTACAPEHGGRIARGWDWRAFTSTLALLFVAEMGDKTQLAVVGLAGRYSQPLVVFLGGALALMAVTALGVVGGESLARRVPTRALMWAPAVAFVGMGALMGAGVL